MFNNRLTLGHAKSTIICKSHPRIVIDYPKYGTMRLLDVSCTIDTHKLANDFNYMPILACQNISDVQQSHFQYNGKLKFEMIKGPSEASNPPMRRYVPSDIIALSKILQMFVDVLLLGTGSDLFVRILRINSNEFYDRTYNLGQKYHKTNFDSNTPYLGIFVVNQFNVDGFEQKFMFDNSDNILTLSIKKNEMLIWNDDTLYHQITPIEAKDKNKIAYIDMYIIYCLT